MKDNQIVMHDWEDLMMKKHAEVVCQNGGDILEIGFNSKYLLDIASQIQGKEIEILLSDSASPALITDPDQDGVIFVLMPMRV